MIHKCKHLMTRLIITLGFTALLTGLLGLSPAHADITAHFEAVAFANAKAEAEATAAAVGEVDVTARMLLEEERASMPASVIKKWESPTMAQTRKHGTLVHSMEAAQRAFNRQIPVYLDLVNDARAAVAKARIKLKYADTAAEKRKWKKRLVQAKKHRKAVFLDENWKFRPLVGMDDGCFRNTGRNGNMVLNSFVECIGPGTKRAEVWHGYDIVKNATRVVLVVFHDGSTKEGCLNFSMFDIPEGTPSEDMVLIVGSLLEVEVTVTVAVTVTGRLTVRGELRRDGVVCDSEEKSKEISVTKYVTKTVSKKSVEEALAFGEEAVNADVELQESVMAEVKRDATVEISQTIDLSCETDSPPAFVQFREMNDLEVNWVDDHCVTIDTPAGHTATVYWEATYGSFATPQKTAQDGVQICSLYKAPSEVPAGGTDRITVRAVDNVTGLDVTKTTQPFVIHPTAPHPG